MAISPGDLAVFNSTTSSCTISSILSRNKEHALVSVQLVALPQWIDVTIQSESVDGSAISRLDGTIVMTDNSIGELGFQDIHMFQYPKRRSFVIGAQRELRTFSNCTYSSPSNPFDTNFVSRRLCPVEYSMLHEFITLGSITDMQRASVVQVVDTTLYATDDGNSIVTVAFNLPRFANQYISTQIYPSIQTTWTYINVLSIILGLLTLFGFVFFFFFLFFI